MSSSTVISGGVVLVISHHAASVVSCLEDPVVLDAPPEHPHLASARTQILVPAQLVGLLGFSLRLPCVAVVTTVLRECGLRCPKTRPGHGPPRPGVWDGGHDCTLSGRVSYNSRIGSRHLTMKRENRAAKRIGAKYPFCGVEN